jgi:hypothetical protein
VDGDSDEQGQQGVDDGTVASVRRRGRAELRERGYTLRSTVRELRQVARLSSWLAAQG